ncbi:MAG: hypothetical protein GY810_10855 [Aureispira sp.]|nr:hypothetical protein [Aureispira sp.]
MKKGLVYILCCFLIACNSSSECSSFDCVLEVTKGLDLEELENLDIDIQLRGKFTQIADERTDSLLSINYIHLVDDQKLILLPLSAEFESEFNSKNHDKEVLISCRARLVNNRRTLRVTEIRELEWFEPSFF